MTEINNTGAEQLTKTQQRKAEKLIETVRQWQAGFVQAGEALIEINGRDTDKPLWIGDSFADYCEVVFDLEKSKVYRLMRAADVVRDLSEFDILPANENQADAMSGLKADNRREVWEAVLATGQRDYILMS